MSSKSISRRDILKSLSLGIVAGSVLRTIPLQAAEYAHHMVAEEKAASPSGAYTPKFFPPNQYATLRALCQTLIPAEPSKPARPNSSTCSLAKILNIN